MSDDDDDDAHPPRRVLSQKPDARVEAMLRLEARERRARRLAQRLGCRLHRSRRPRGINNLGDFMILDRNNVIIAGARFDMDIDAVEGWLGAPYSPVDHPPSDTPPLERRRWK